MHKTLFSTYRKCPICDSHIAYLLHQQFYAEKMLGILPQYYNIVQCKRCGFIFDDMEADANTFSRYYSESNKYSAQSTVCGGSLTSSDLRRFQNTVHLLEPHLKCRNQTIADFGAGNGGLLKCFYDAGFKNITAYEASPGCVEYIKKNCNFNAVETDINNIHVEALYDLILCSQVFEHLYDPKEVLDRLTDLIPEHGLIYLEMPDAERYCERFVSPYHYFDTEHINHFSVDFIKYLLQQRNFTIIDFGFFDIPMQKDILYPNFFCLARKNEKATVQTDDNLSCFSSSEKLFHKICLYLKKSEEEDAKKKRILEKIDGPVCIWGIGAYAMRLLECGTFDGIDIDALIDKDKSKQGTKIKNHEILSPDYLYKNQRDDLSVIITSVLYCKEIEKELRNNNFRGNIIPYT